MPHRQSRGKKKGNEKQQVNTKVREGGAPGAEAEIPLQPMGKTTLDEISTLQP